MNEQLLAHDHSELDAELAGFFTALAEGRTEQSFNHLDLFWARLAMHIRAENLHLFPALVRAAEQPGSPRGTPSLKTVQTAVARLRDDHDFFMKEITAAVKVLRKLQRGQYPYAAAVFPEVCERMTSVSQRLETHNAFEESKVYGWTCALLDKTEQETLVQSIQRELENLPQRFRTK